MAESDERLLLDDNAFANDYMMSLSKIRQDMITDCMFVLGYPAITLFITQRQIDRLIDLAVHKCEEKASQTFLETLYNAAGCIDVSQYRMEAVKYIYRADIGSADSSGAGCGTNCGCACGSAGSTVSPFEGCNICDKLCKYRMYSFGLTDTSGRSRLYDRLAYQYAQSELSTFTFNDWYLDVSEKKLYLDGFTGWITVQYVKSDITVEDLVDNTHWKNWVRDYVFAMAKIIEGRIRGKYKLQTGPFEIESDELISEGTSEKENLESQLNEDMGYWNILRSAL